MISKNTWHHVLLLPACQNHEHNILRTTSCQSLCLHSPSSVDCGHILETIVYCNTGIHAPPYDSMQQRRLGMRVWIPTVTAPTSLFRSVDRMLQHSAHHINTVIIRWLQQRNSWLTGCCHHCNICVLLREKKTWIHRMALKGWVGLLWSEREVVGLQWSEREKEGLLIVDISLRSWYIALQVYLASFPGSSLRQYATKKSGNEGMDTWFIYCTDFPLQISGFHVPTFSSPYT